MHNSTSIKTAIGNLGSAGRTLRRWRDHENRGDEVSHWKRDFAVTQIKKRKLTTVRTD